MRTKLWLWCATVMILTLSGSAVPAAVLDSFVTTSHVIYGDSSRVIANVGEDLLITFYASDTTGFPPLIEILGLPPMATFIDLGDGRARLSWLPVDADGGAFDVDLIVSDQSGDDTTSFIIVANRAPTFTIPCPALEVMEGQRTFCPVFSSDPDEDFIRTEWNQQPPTAEFRDLGGGLAQLSFTPEYADVDSLYLAVFVSSDGWAVSSDTIAVKVINRPLTVVAYPPATDSDLLVDDTVTVIFNEDINIGSLDSGLIILSRAATGVGYSVDVENGALSIHGSDGFLPPGDIIEISLTTGILDLAGYGLDSNYSFTFYTGAAVRPGEANGDGVVDERDILPIGLYWGQAGPAREPDNQGVEWGTYPTHIFTGDIRWDPPEAVAADADGNGVVDADDICGVAENWLRGIDSISLSRAFSGGAMAKTLGSAVFEALAAAIAGCQESPGKRALEGIFAATTNATSEPSLPTTLQLDQNYPNPFNPETRIRFGLPTAMLVTLEVYDITGRRVVTLVETGLPAGFHALTWDGRSGRGKPVASGVYFYRLSTPDITVTRKMLLLK